MVEQCFGTVAYRYGVKLVRGEKVPDSKGSNGRQEHYLHMQGRVHPEPYNHATAVELVQQKIAEFLTEGWEIRDLEVKAWDA